METGPHGVYGLHAVSPAAQELMKKRESAITRLHNMAGRTVLVATVKLTTALKRHVLVSLIASNVICCIKHHLHWIWFYICEKKAL